jgi:5-methylcytosine-specific restriction protein A
MPVSPLKPCSYPGCPILVPRGYCANHAERRAAELPRPDYHMPDHQHLYNRGWRVLRQRHLALHPWCEDCLGRGVYMPATDVHHVSRHLGNPLTFRTSPLLALCHACHSAHTANEVWTNPIKKIKGIGV